MSTNLDVRLMASLLLRQHAALGDEGIGLAKETPGDEDLLNAAWDLVGDEFGLHWGYEYGFVESSEHSRSCDCVAGRVYRGELVWCTGCQKHVPPDHVFGCGPSGALRSIATRWLTSDAN